MGIYKNTNELVDQGLTLVSDVRPVLNEATRLMARAEATLSRCDEVLQAGARILAQGESLLSLQRQKVELEIAALREQASPS